MARKKSAVEIGAEQILAALDGDLSNIIIHDVPVDLTRRHPANHDRKAQQLHPDLHHSDHPIDR